MNSNKNLNQYFFRKNCIDKIICAMARWTGVYVRNRRMLIILLIAIFLLYLFLSKNYIPIQHSIIYVFIMSLIQLKIL